MICTCTALIMEGKAKTPRQLEQGGQDTDGYLGAATFEPKWNFEGTSSFALTLPGFLFQRTSRTAVPSTAAQGFGRFRWPRLTGSALLRLAARQPRAGRTNKKSREPPAVAPRECLACEGSRVFALDHAILGREAALLLENRIFEPCPRLRYARF
jgi:hypothetical protein